MADGNAAQAGQGADQEPPADVDMSDGQQGPGPASGVGYGSASTDTAAVTQGAGTAHPGVAPAGQGALGAVLCGGPWPVEPEAADPGPLEPMYLQLFLLKYVCSGVGCYGTLAPAGPGSSQLECSVCGVQRSEMEFLAELEN